LVVYSSSTFGDQHGDQIDKQVARCLKNVRLETVYPLGLYLSQCNNFFAALDIATQYLVSKRCQTILMVFADRVLDESTRFKNLAINSDAASACVLTTRHDLNLPLSLEGLSIKTHLTDKDMIDPSSNALDIELHERYLNGITSVFDQALNQANIDRDNLNALVCHNFTFSALRQIANKININEALVFKDNIIKFGHAYTCDTLINLHDCIKRLSITSDDTRIGVIGTGLYFWGSAIFKLNHYEKDTL
jgi:3-oxoacyl-[acyl-carrier-protein] synthase III